jgi:hypothetical protein
LDGLDGAVSSYAYRVLILRCEQGIVKGELATLRARSL